MTDSVRLQRQAGAAARPGPGGPDVRLLSWLAFLGIGASIAIMTGASLIRPDWMYPPMVMPASGPPWQVSAQVQGGVVAWALWASALLAVGGVAAGLVAVRRGARWPVRAILIVAAVAVLALALLPPAGSTDALDYAAYGRLALLGDNPYVATPLYLRLTDPVFGVSIPVHWQHQVSLYGPAGTIEQYLAARLGGNSMARVVFWLKLWNALAFGAVALVLDRVLRASRAARLRAHLLWTLNPLLLWGLIAAGHIDVLAAGAGVLGLLVLGRQTPGLQPRLWRCSPAALSSAWRPTSRSTTCCSAWGRPGPCGDRRRSGRGRHRRCGDTRPYLCLARQAGLLALFARRDKTTQDSFYRFADLTNWKYLAVVAILLSIGMAVLLLRRMPAGDLLRPAIRPALALSVAWLLVWPYTLPWYDAMIICVLVLYPASRLDWLILARLGAATIANMPGDPSGVPGTALKSFDVMLVHGFAPAVLLAVALATVYLAVSGRWDVQPWPGPDVAAPLPGYPGSRREHRFVSRPAGWRRSDDRTRRGPGS